MSRRTVFAARALALALVAVSAAPATVVLRAVDTSGNRSGPSNELNITC